MSLLIGRVVKTSDGVFLIPLDRGDQLLKAVRDFNTTDADNDEALDGATERLFAAVQATDDGAKS